MTEMGRSVTEMSDLVKREDAIKAIKQWLDNDGSLFDVGLKQAIREIKRLPSADRPRGEWIERYGSSRGIYECSKCGNLIHSPYEDIRKKFHAYCGRCGADMRGADDE